MFNFKLKRTTEIINFGEEQLNALSKLKSFLDGKELSITLSGSAGTGKTSLLIAYIDYLNENDIPYILAAPTHKAKLVMETFTGEQAVTIHQLLGLQPNLDILELDLKELDFLSKSSSNKPNQIPYKGVIIVDEASMVNNDLFEFIVDSATNNHSKILWVGDIKQIQPVKSETLSKVFSLNNIINLTKIYRQKEDSPVLDLLGHLREHSVSNVEAVKGISDSIYTYNVAKDFLIASKDIMKETVNNGEVLNAKILAYTNKRVEGFNTAIRKLVFGKESINEINIKEILMCYNTMDYANNTFYNSLDYIIYNEPKLITKQLPECKYLLNGYELDLFDTVYKKVYKIFLLSQQHNDPKLVESYIEYIENVRLYAVRLKQQRKPSSSMWAKYYSMINSFACLNDFYYDNRIIKRKTFSYGYSTTVHKSQGSSFNTVFIDLANVNSCSDPNVLRQLQYVGMSRTRGDIHILQ